MNRLESIKERLKSGITEYMHDGDKAEIYRKDAKYLLQRLERYENALKGVSNYVRLNKNLKLATLIDEALEE